MPTECERNAIRASTQSAPITAAHAKDNNTPITATISIEQQQSEQSTTTYYTNNHNSSIMENDMSTSQTSTSSSTNGSCNSSKKAPIISSDPTAYVAKARVTRPTPPPPPYNPMQFVQIKPCNLYQTAQEQLKKAEEVKKIKEIRKEEPEDWQNNLDNWKSSRRKRVEHIIDRVVEVKKLELEEHDRTRRKSKTFSEMIEERGERAGRGLNKLASLAVYNEDESNDLSDLGIGTSSASGKSSLSDDYDNNSVMSDNVNEAKQNNNKKPRVNSTTREYISSPGYETSSSTAPASSPDPCEYTYEGAIQDYKQRVSRAASGLISMTYNKLSTATNKILNNGTANGAMTSKDSTPERLHNGNSNNGYKESYPPRRGSKIEDRLMGFEVQSPSEECVEQKKVDVPKIDISKRKEIFENQKQPQQQLFNPNDSKALAGMGNSGNGNVNGAPRVTLKDRFKIQDNTEVSNDPNKKDMRRLSGDITSIKERLQSLEQQQNVVNCTNGTMKTSTLVDIAVPPLKERLSSLQNAATKEEVRKPPVKLVDARQLEIMKGEEEKAKQALKDIKSSQLQTESVASQRITVDKDANPVVNEGITKQQDDKLHAAIEALALEEKQLTEAANVVNQIEAEFEELTLTTIPLAPLPHSSSNVTDTSAATNTNETMEYSINEALELALAAIDQESKQTVPATTITQTDVITQTNNNNNDEAHLIITKQITTTTKMLPSNNNNNNNNNNTNINNHNNDTTINCSSSEMFSLKENKTDKEKVENDDLEKENQLWRVDKTEEEISKEPIYVNVNAIVLNATTTTTKTTIVAAATSTAETIPSMMNNQKIALATTSTTTTLATSNNPNNNNNCNDHLLNNNCNDNKEIHEQQQQLNINNSNNNNNNSQQIIKCDNNNICGTVVNVTNAFANPSITSPSLSKTTTTIAANITSTTILNTATTTTTAITDSAILSYVNNENGKGIIHPTSPTTEFSNNFNTCVVNTENDIFPPLQNAPENKTLTNNNACTTITTTPTPTATPTTTINELPNTVDLEPYYQVPKSSEPYYDAPKHLIPIPVYENIEIFFNTTNNTTTTTTIPNDALQMASVNLEPPKEKPPPPPTESPPPFDELDSQTDTYSSDNTYETLTRHLPNHHLHYRYMHANHGPPHSPAIDQSSLPSPPIKRMNSTKRIKKELRNKRSSFLGIEGTNLDDDDSYLELTVAPPPDMVQLLEEERRLEKQLYLKAGLCDSSDTGESRDSGVSENHSRQSSEHFTNSSEENESHDITTPSPLTLETQSPTSPRNGDELIYQNDGLLQVAPVTPLLQTVKGNSAESWTESATVAAAATKSLTEATATANAKMMSIEEKIREQEEVLRVERELLQLEQEELKRQRENLMLRENMARRELQHGAKMLMSANRRSLQDLQGLQVAALSLNNGALASHNEHIEYSVPIHHPMALGPFGGPSLPPNTTTTALQTQQIYANLPNLQEQYYHLDNNYRKSMSDINELSKRMMMVPPPMPPTKPMRAIQVVANNADQTEFLPRQRHSLNSQQFGGSLVKIAQPVTTAAASVRPPVYTNYHHHHQSAQNLTNTTGNVLPPTIPNASDVNGFSQPMYPGQMSRNTLHALSATPKPKYTDGWVQVQNRKSYETNVANDPAWLSAYQQKRKSMPDTYSNSNNNNNNNNSHNHWLVQEAEHRRLAQQQQQQQQQLPNRRPLIPSNNITHVHPSISNGAANSNGKPLPDAIIQTLTERVQSKGLGERKRNHLDKSPLRTNINSYYQQYNNSNNNGNMNKSTPLQLPTNGNNNMQRSSGGQNPINKTIPTTITTTNTTTLPNGSQQQQQQPQQDKILSVSGKKKCSHCGDELGRGAAMIIESLLLFYHINCFKCCVCHVQLGDGLNGTDVRVRNHKLHCQNCYSSDDGIKFSCV